MDTEDADREMAIFVRVPSGATIILQVLSSDTIYMVKRLILVVLGIPARQRPLRLTHISAISDLDPEDPELEDELTLAYYSIGDAAICEATYSFIGPLADQQFNIIVIIAGPLSVRQLELSVKASDTIWSVKHQIYVRTHLPVQRQQLRFGHQELLDNCTPYDYGLHSQAVCYARPVAPGTTTDELAWL